MEMIQFDKNLFKFILIWFFKNETTKPHCNSSTLNTDESRRSEDAVTTGVKKKEEESQIEAKRSSGFTLRLASLKTKNQDWWSNGQAIADLYAAKGWNIFCILK